MSGRFILCLVLIILPLLFITIDKVTLGTIHEELTLIGISILIMLDRLKPRE